MMNPLHLATHGRLTGNSLSIATHGRLVRIVETDTKGDGGKSKTARPSGIRRPLLRDEAAEIFGRNQIKPESVAPEPLAIEAAPAFGEPDHTTQKIVLPAELAGQLDDDEAIAMILAMVT